ncbi:MAG: hypothetical protein A2Z95_04020 [Gallionellales bacterium GWA2_60_18]|nr:MAG: hypothetical protein A2Z95_04020 [Gallionellales bacterium GWA2_60_18]
MADIKSAQAFLDDLPKNDAHKTLMELAEWMESVAAQTDFKPEHQFEVLRLLDETAQPYARKLARDYFTPQELNKFQENRLWLVLGNWHTHAANAYSSLFDRYCKGDKGMAALRPQLPLLAARTLHAMTAQLKYVCVRYGPIDPALWANVARHWQHAEQQQYLDTPLSLYPGLPGDATVKSGLAHLLGWYGCGVSTLNPMLMHLTERIAAQYCTVMDAGAQQDADSLFSFDLARPDAPMRVKVGVTMQPSTRFIGMAGLRAKLEALIRTLEKNIVPDELNLGGTYDAGPVHLAALHLLNYVAEPPLRRGARRGIRVGMKVVSGFAGMVERTDAGLNFNAEAPAQWEAQDISASGFRAVLPVQAAEGIRIGSLLGVQPEGVAYWGAAVVRRLKRDEANQLHIGAAMLSRQFDGVTLQASGDGGGFEDGQPALYLHAQQGEPPGEVRLLMKAETFSMQRSLQTRLDGKSYLLIPAGLQEKGGDYDLARFRIIEQEAGEP